MKKPNKKQTITGVAISISLIAGYFVADNITEDLKIQTNIIEKSETGELTYDEYIKLVEQYNKTLQETKSKSEPFILEDINVSNTVIQRLNEKIK